MTTKFLSKRRRAALTAAGVIASLSLGACAAAPGESASKGSKDEG